MLKVDGSSGFVNYLNKLFKDPVKLPKAQPIKAGLAILSNGGGYTVPIAIRNLERQAKNQIKEINYSSFSLDTPALSAEVKIILDYIEKNNLQDKYLSRADAFISLVKEDKINFVDENNEPIKKLSLEVINKITKEAEGLDGIFLPGGEDVPSAWYGGDQCENVYRSIVEFTLINLARNKGIPLMGVCRGMQIVNVFNGKKLEYDVPNQRGNQQFTLIEKGKKGLLAKFFEQGVTGKVMHHQGVSISEGTNGKGELEPLTAYDGLIKCAESKYPAAAPVVLTQFHPEFYDDHNSYRLSANNADFIKTFHDGAVVRGNKRLFITPEKLTEARGKLTPVGTRQKQWEQKQQIRQAISVENKIANLFHRFQEWITCGISRGFNNIELN